MLTATHPGALAGLAALPLLWWWHRARQRPVEVAWPSLLLWKRLHPPDPAALARHRRRADLTLWLALAGVLALVVSAAEIVWTAKSRESLRVAIVLDATASARGSFPAIREDAENFVKGLPSDAVVDVAIVPVGAWPAGPRDEALSRLRNAAGTDAPGDPAVAAARFAADDLVVVFSDRAGAGSVAKWRVHPAPPDAAAVESLTMADGELFAVVRAGAGSRVMAHVAGEQVEVLIGESGRALVRRRIGASTSTSVSLEAPDGFPSNDARFWCAASERTAVGIAGRDFPALRRALEGAGIQPELGGAPAIWIGAVPAAAPSGPAVIIDPPSGVPGLFEVEGELTSPDPRIPEPDHALLKVAAAADLAQLTAAKTRKLRFTRPVVTLVESYIYQAGQTLVLAFDPAAPNSNWTRLISFPIFWADAARPFRPVSTRTISTGDTLPGRDGPQAFLHSGLFTHDGSPVAVNLDDPAELASAASPATPASPQLDLPDKAVIRSVRSVPPAGGALAGLLLLVCSWLAARPRRR